MLIDLVFAVLLLIACIKGYQKGLVIALFSIIAFIIGLAAALKLSTLVAAWLKDSLSVSGKWLPFISFILVFFIVVLLVRLGSKLIEKTFQALMLGWANRLGGMIFYALLYIIIFSVFLFFCEKIHLFEPSVIESSLTYHFVQPWGPKVINGLGNIIPVFKGMFISLERFFGTEANKISY